MNEVIQMDIMLEAYEAHGIEQQARMKHKKRFHQLMQAKTEYWLSIFKRVKQGEGLNAKEQQFLLREIGYFHDPSLSKSEPFLEEHVKRMEEKRMNQTLLSLYANVVKSYKQALSEIEKQATIPFFSKKKRLTNIIAQSLEILKDTESSVDEIAFCHSNRNAYFGDREWKEQELKWNRNVALMIEERLVDAEENQWLLQMSKSSIHEQIDTGNWYFSHHFDRVREGSETKERIRGLERIFQDYRNALLTISKKNVTFFNKKMLFDLIREICQDVNWEHRRQYDSIFLYLDKWNNKREKGE